MKSAGLSKREKIKCRKSLEYVFTKGKSVVSKNKFLKGIYLINKGEEPSVKTAFFVPKKNGCAVWRNRTKRLLRESYRLNKNVLSNVAIKQVKLEIIFLTIGISENRNKKIRLSDISGDVIDIMNQINCII